MARSNAGPTAHLDPKVVELLAAKIPDLLAESVTGIDHADPPAIRRQLAGNGPGASQLRRQVAQAILHRWYSTGYEPRRRRRRGEPPDLDSRAIDIIANGANSMLHPDGTPIRLVIFDGNTARAQKIRLAFAQATWKTLNANGWELRRGRHRG